MPNTYTVKEAADVLGYSTNSIYSFLKEGSLQGKRIGKGKFKIPHSEIEKFLTDDGGNTKQQTTVSPPKLRASFSAEEITAPHSFVSEIIPAPSSMPSLFDWFVGVAAIVYGASLFVFQIYYAQANYDILKLWVFPLRFIFIIGGIGLLYSDITLHALRRIWHKVFSGVLIVAFAATASFFYFMDDYDGSVIMGLFSLLLLLHVAFGIRSIATFTLFEMVIIVLLPAIALIAGTTAISSMVGLLVDPQVVLFTWLIGGVITSSLVAYGYFRNRRLYWILMGLLSFSFIGTAVGYAASAYWGRSLIFLLTGLVGFLIPLWDTMRFASKKERAGVYVVFSAVLVLFVTTLIVAGVIQGSVIDFAQKDTQSKAQYAKVLVESIIESAEHTVEHASTNTAVHSALLEANYEAAAPLLRNIADSTRNLRAAFILDAEGTMQIIYPHELDLVGQNFATRDYFQAAQSKNGVFITDIFYGATNRPVIILSKAVVDSDGEFIGLIAASLDIGDVNQRLQLIGNPDAGDYVMMLDEADTFIAHPQESYINTSYTPVSEYDLNRAPAYYDKDQVLRGVEELYSREVVPKTNWTIEVRTPLVTILKPASTAKVSIGFIILISALLVCVYIFFHRRTPLQNTDSAP